MAIIRTNDGTDLFHQDWGTGKPIVFLHAWMLNSDMWQYSVADFNDSGHRCLALDRRGHGRSDSARDDYRLERLVDDVATTLDQLDLRDVTLVGHSFAGQEVVGYLARHGTQRVARAVLLAPATPFLLKTDDNPGGFDPGIVTAVRRTWVADFPKWTRDNAEAFYRPGELGISQGLVDWTIDMMVANGLQIALRTNQILIDSDQRAAMKTLDLPVLVIHGDADASIPVQFGRMSAQLVQGSKYVEYAGAPHGLFLTHRAQIHRDVVSFMKETAK